MLFAVLLIATPVKDNVFLLSLFLVIVWTLAAFGEELVHRGYLMNRVAELAGARNMAELAGGSGMAELAGGSSMAELAGGSSLAWAVSLVVVSVLFGVAHLYQGISGVVTNIAAGLVYGALYLSSGRTLWAPIIAHGVYDTLAFLLAFWGKYPGL